MWAFALAASLLVRRHPRRGLLLPELSILNCQSLCAIRLTQSWFPLDPSRENSFSGKNFQFRCKWTPKTVLKGVNAELGLPPGGNWKRARPAARIRDIV